jgi:uncharacterized surface protein with fasciclin (FAS1) repeats
MLARASVLGCLALNAAPMPQEGDTVVQSASNNISVLQLASGIPELSTLVRALKAANLTDALSTPGWAYTILAPTNEAFAQLPPGRLEGLLDPSNIEELQAVLKYHVGGGIAYDHQPVYSKYLSNGLHFNTLEGEQVAIRIGTGYKQPQCTKKCSGGENLANGAIFFDRARVDKPDLAASNGVIHTIGGVLEPLGLNHLYFRYFIGDCPAASDCGNCGQVDAGPRMPKAMFDKENAAALQMYIDATLAFAWLPLFPRRHLELGTCSGSGFTDNDGVPGISPMLNVPCRDIEDGPGAFLPDNRTIDWGPNKLMEPICLQHCECDYRGDPGTTPCKDVPDNPAAASWCSLCGPKFNRPIEIQCFKTEEH